MPMFETAWRGLNASFHASQVEGFAKQRSADFAPGKPLDLSFAVGDDAVLQRAFKGFFDKTPPSMKEALRAVIHQALTASPPTPVTFAWAPAYDYELTIWHSHDTATTRGGITVLMKSRYPADAHPQAAT
jgi:hypothetical protein